MRLPIFIILLLLFGGSSIAQNQDGHIIRSIYFGGGSYYIDGYQAGRLYEFLDSIPNIQGYSITIHSHTDNIGGVEYNEWLSEMRSESVIQILKNRNILEEMIERKDFGQLNPVFDNRTQLGRMKNRRVDIIFWPMAL